MIRVGLIGAGFIGRVHFDQYDKLTDRARIVAICDKEPDRRAGRFSRIGGNLPGFAGQDRDLHDVRQYADWRDLLADADVDMVDICAPTFLHCEISVAALNAGKHVLCEKPMALNVHQCDDMLAAAARAKGKFMIAQCIRFWPEYVYLRQVFQDGRYGELKAVHFRRQAGIPGYSLNNWILDPTLSGGGSLDLHVHDVDYAIQLLGKPKAVFAQAYQRAGGGIDRVHALWDYGPDRVVQLEGFWDMPGAFTFNMGYTAVFEKAGVHYDIGSGKPLTVYRNGTSETPAITGSDGYRAELEYFLDCIERDTAPTISTPVESRDAVALAMAERQSARTGMPVSVA